MVTYARVMRYSAFRSVGPVGDFLDISKSPGGIDPPERHLARILTHHVRRCAFIQLRVNHYQLPSPEDGKATSWDVFLRPKSLS